MARGDRNKDGRVTNNASNKKSSNGEAVKNKNSNVNKVVRKIISFLLVLAIIYVIFSGWINQREVGESFIEWATRMAQRIGEIIEQIFSGEGFIEINKDGVYFR